MNNGEEQLRKTEKNLGPLSIHMYPHTCEHISIYTSTHAQRHRKRTRKGSLFSGHIIILRKNLKLTGKMGKLESDFIKVSGKKKCISKSSSFYILATNK